MPDPALLFRHARREALVTLTAWALALLWTVGYCVLRGYDHPPDGWLVRAGLAVPRRPDDLRVLAGFPDWVFFGILLPWLACTLFTIVYALLGMPDDPLAPPEEGPPRGP